jgi:hypothetical protein
MTIVRKSLPCCRATPRRAAPRRAARLSRALPALAMSGSEKETSAGKL